MSSNTSKSTSKTQKATKASDNVFSRCSSRSTLSSKAKDRAMSTNPPPATTPKVPAKAPTPPKVTATPATVLTPPPPAEDNGVALHIPVPDPTQDATEPDPELEPGTAPPSSTASSNLMGAMVLEEDSDGKDSDDEIEITNVAAPEPYKEAAFHSDTETYKDGKQSFIKQYWDGDLPIPVGKVAKLFARTHIEEQLQQIERAIMFNPNTNPSYMIGNFSTIFTPFLVAVPGSFRKVRVIYALQEANPNEQEFFQNTPVGNKILALTGELITNITIPTAYVLPANVIEARPTKVPNGKDFAKKRRDVTVSGRATWFTKDKVDESLDIPPAVPIPAFLIYDAFDCEVDAVVIYERISALPSESQNKFKHTIATLRNFLKAQTVSITKKHPQTTLPQKIFLETPPSIVHEWKRQVLKA